MFRDLDAIAPDGDDPGVEHLGLPDRRARGGHRPARPRDRLALGIARAGDASWRRSCVTPQTSEETIDAVTEAARRCGKNPIVVKDNPMAWGFVANRVYFAMVARSPTGRR